MDYYSHYTNRGACVLRFKRYHECRTCLHSVFQLPLVWDMAGPTVWIHSQTLNLKSSSREHLFPHQQTRRMHIGKGCKVWPPSSWHLNTFSPNVLLYKPPLLTKIRWSFSCSLCSTSSSFDTGSISQKPLSGKQSGTHSSFFAVITHWISSAGSFSQPHNELKFGIILTKKLKIIRLLSWVWL